MKRIDVVKYSVFLPVIALLACLLIHVNAHAAATGKIYFSVEKFTIGQGFLVEPCEVTITEGEKVSKITERVLKAKGYVPVINSGTWYLEGIKNADSGTVKVPLCIRNEWGSNLLTESDRDLCEFDYSNSSGWTYYCNNISPAYMADSWKVHNGDVIRWRFTLHYGDLGSERLAVPNMDALIKAMAVFNANRQLCVEKGYLTAYNEASRFVTDMDSSFIDESQPGHTEKEIEAKIRKLCGNLPTEGTVKQWKAEKEAEKKAAAAKRKKYTPSAPKWKSIKSVRKGTASLVWKKNSKATGYEIYMSTKKSSGYKKIATVKNGKKVTYTKKKLKRKKTYYFKLKAYKTVSGTKYRSSFSAVKKVKVK